MNGGKGFSIIEAAIALAILTIGAVSIWSLFVVGSRLNAESEDRAIAADVAQAKVEEMMNTRYRYIVAEHPPGVVEFESQPLPASYQKSPYWTRNVLGEWITSLPEGKYEIIYPDGVDADPLRILVRITWRGSVYSGSSVDLETLVSMTPGRFRAPVPVLPSG